MEAHVLIRALSYSTVRAFLSFVTKDKPLVDEFRRALEFRNENLGRLDHAVQDEYDKDWKLGCAEKIDQSALLICLLGTTTHRSETGSEGDR